MNDVLLHLRSERQWYLSNLYYSTNSLVLARGVWNLHFWNCSSDCVETMKYTTLYTFNARLERVHTIILRIRVLYLVTSLPISVIISSMRHSCLLFNFFSTLTSSACIAMRTNYWFWREVTVVYLGHGQFSRITPRQNQRLALRQDRLNHCHEMSR